MHLALHVLLRAAYECATILQHRRHAGRYLAVSRPHFPVFHVDEFHRVDLGTQVSRLQGLSEEGRYVLA